MIAKIKRAGSKLSFSYLFLINVSPKSWMKRQLFFFRVTLSFKTMSSRAVALKLGSPDPQGTLEKKKKCLHWQLKLKHPVIQYTLVHKFVKPSQYINNTFPSIQNMAAFCVGHFLRMLQQNKLFLNYYFTLFRVLRFENHEALKACL